MINILYSFNQSQIRMRMKNKELELSTGTTRAKTRIAAFQSWMTAWMRETAGCCFGSSSPHAKRFIRRTGYTRSVVHHVGLMEVAILWCTRSHAEDEFNYAMTRRSHAHRANRLWAGDARWEYGSWLGHEDEFNALPDMKKAQKRTPCVSQFKSASTDEPGCCGVRLKTMSVTITSQHGTMNLVRNKTQNWLQSRSNVPRRIPAHETTFELHTLTFHTWCGSMYIDGTCGYPVILIDLEAHRGYEDQIGKSINHELRHAIQDAEGPITTKMKQRTQWKKRLLKPQRRQARDIQRGNWIAERDGVSKLRRWCPRR